MASTMSHSSEPFKYSDYYDSYKAAKYWRDVKEVNGSSVSSGTDPGRAVWNTSGTYGAGVISESMGYAMMLAALYNDKTTFDQLSATVQTTIKGNEKPLMSWYLTEGNDSKFTIRDPNSAGDGDINIALAYIYADQAASIYGWGSSTTNNELYYTLAKNYATAIRQNDFSTNDSEANNHILQDGFKQAEAGFAGNNWHPDYSDPRAYQLFELYDTEGASFWEKAQDYTKEAWKAVFNFGANDTGRSENLTTGTIDASKYYVNISNPTYGALKASDQYSDFTFNRYGSDYNSDSQRLPMRILNYINAEENTADVDMIGVANANLKALNKHFADTNYWYIPDTLKIATPYDGDGDFTQNFTAAGLLAYAGNSHLSDPAGTSTTVANLNTMFGTNGINGTSVSPSGGWAIGNGLQGDDVFNDALTLWGLTVYAAGNTDLERSAMGADAASADLLGHMNSINSSDPITGNLMLSETGKKDTFIFSKNYLSANRDDTEATGTVRIVNFNRKEDRLGFDTNKLKGAQPKIKTFANTRKANKLIKNDQPFILDRRTGELYTTLNSSNADRFSDLTPFAQFVEPQTRLGNIQADLI